ncbi:MAG: amidohydrolase [Deltaproteobacteria bacterium]|nr:amidohydrolase [Deltaproteobacteria bacterium]
MTQTAIFSADSHTMEPANLWTQRMDSKWRDRAPRVISNYEGRKGSVFVAEGLTPFPVGGGFAAGKDPKDLAANQSVDYEEARPSGWDPVERVKDQDIDGVEGEILYTTLGMFLFHLKDTELQWASFRAYNDWVAEFCSYAPKRLIGLGLIALQDVTEGVRELQRIAKKGLRGAMINATAPGDVPFSDPHFDPFWAAAQDLGLPLSLHILTGKKNVQLTKGRVASTVTIIHEIQTSLLDFLYNGILERFPRLKLVSAENDIGWVAHYLYRLDECYRTLRYIDPTPITMKPSEYFKRQVYATFQDDRPGVTTYEFAGADNLMWASDFPHRASTWPRSREVITQNFAGIPADVTRKITYDNVHRLYGL